jgi:FixJ family two-component response regulator
LANAQPVIYVVDDDDSVRKSLRRLLRSVGFEVETCASGAQLLARLPLPADAIVILDLRMPVQNGLDVQRELRTRGAAAPVIFITAHEDDEARQSAMASGALGFVRKPFDESVLLNLVEHAVVHCEQAAVAAAAAARKAAGPAAEP